LAAMPAAPDTVLRVALPVPLPRLFDYLPPPGASASAADVGRRVRVPFGQRQAVGLVAGAGPADVDADGLRQVVAFLDEAPLLAGELLESVRWLARYTHAPPGEVLATALPAALRRGEPAPDTREPAWRLTEAGATALPGMREGRPRQLATLLAGGVRHEDVLDGLLPGWRPAARTLAGRGLAEPVALPSRQLAGEARPGPVPNQEQAEAIQAIRSAEGFTPFLLDGVTGSGKTEVYLHAIAACLARGRQALVLVPEIGLTPQLLGRFRARLGVPVHVSHSGLGD